MTSTPRKMTAQNIRIARRQIDRMTEQFGNQELHARNAAFAQWYAAETQKAERVVALIVFVFVTLAVLAAITIGATHVRSSVVASLQETSNEA
jgi:hypothetical protein